MITPGTLSVMPWLNSSWPVFSSWATKPAMAIMACVSYNQLGYLSASALVHLSKVLFSAALQYLHDKQPVEAAEADACQGVISSNCWQSDDII